jgi:hypothetical protein
LTNQLTVPEIRRRAAELIEERGWHQGDWTGADGSICLNAALLLAVHPQHNFVNPEWPDVTLAVHEAVLGELEVWERAEYRDSLADWQDAPGRTVDEVLAALLRGIEP